MPFRDPAFILTYGASKLGKCYAASSKVTLADGRVLPIREIVRSGILPTVVAMDRDYRLRAAPVSQLLDNGVKPIVRVQLADGRSVRLTPNDPLFTQRGWVPAGWLTGSDLVAVPRVSPFFGNDDAPEGALKLLAYHLADGTFHDSALCVTEGNPLKVADLASALRADFPDTELHRAMLHGEPTISYRLACAVRGQQTSSAMAFLRRLGLEEKHAATKFVPDFVFTLRRPLLALFLSRYLGCDGAVHADGTASFSSASQRMAHEMAHLLLRFGAFGRLREKVVRATTCYEWQCLDAGAVAALHREVGLFTKPASPRTAGPSKHDRLPVAWSDVPPDHRSRPGRRHPTSHLTREMGQRLFDVGDEVHRLAHSDLLWRKVDSVEPAGKEHTYDLSVPLWHNFVVDDVIGHNTTDFLYSFPQAFYMAPPGALKPGVNVVGHEPPPEHVWDPPSVQDATAFLPKLAASKRFGEVVVDDFSLLAERTVLLLQKRGLGGWDLWGTLYGVVVDFRDQGRRCGMHLVVCCHEKPAGIVNGLAQRGGPKLPGKLPEAMPTVGDMVLRATYAGGIPGAANGHLGWPGMYRCAPNDPGFVSGDRHGVTPDPSPMNLAELMRAAGYLVRRAPGLEWMDDAVCVIATEMVKRPPAEDRMVLDAARRQLFHPSVNPLHVRWVLRDAVDRVVIARSRRNPFAIFGL